MTSQVFYRKWRPQTLAEVIGQEQVTTTLLNALSAHRLSHAYLFCGPRGTGKTSTGRILAKAVNCLTNKGNGEPCNTCEICLSITEGRSLDVIEIDAASNTGVDDIRELRERVNYSPAQARFKVYIIDEFHMLSNSASNALLKTLEEPPPHVIFVLATTEVHKILPTIMSRCQRFDFRRIATPDIVNKLSAICREEDIEVAPEALTLITRSAQGSLRDAENILQQINIHYGNSINLNQVQQTLGISEDWRTRELLKHIISGNIADGLKTLNSVNNDGLNLKQFNRELVSHLRNLLLVKSGANESLDVTGEDKKLLAELAASTSLAKIVSATKLFGQLELGKESYSSLPLELALVECQLMKNEVRQKNAPVKEPVAAKENEPPVRKKKKEAAPAIAMPSENPSPLTEQIEPSPEKIGIVKEDKLPVPVAENTTATESAVAVAEPANELEKLKMQWDKVIAQAPHDVVRTNAIAILRSGGVVPVACDQDKVVLCFKYPIHKDKISEPKNLQIAEKIISNFLGRPCRVQCTFQEEDNRLVQEAQRLGAEIINVEEK